MFWDGVGTRGCGPGPASCASSLWSVPDEHKPFPKEGQVSATFRASVRLSRKLALQPILNVEFAASKPRDGAIRFRVKSSPVVEIFHRSSRSRSITG